MRKDFCDICGAEIKPNSLSGGIIRDIKAIQMLPAFDSRGRPSLAPQEKIQNEIWDLCESCQKAIWEFAIKKKEECERSKA